MATKNWMYPNNIFGSANLEDKITYCTTNPQLRGPGTDHMPILTALELPTEQVTTPPSHNFKLVDWGAFQAAHSVNLSLIKRISQCAQSAQYIGWAEAQWWAKILFGSFSKG